MRRSDFKLGLSRPLALPVLGVVAGLLAFAPTAKANLLIDGDFNTVVGGAPAGWGSYAVDTTTAQSGGAFTSYKYPGDGSTPATDGTAADPAAFDATPYVAFGNYNYSNAFGSEYSGYNQTVPGLPGVTYDATIESATANYGYPDADFHLIYLAADGSTILREDSVNIANYPNEVNNYVGAFSQPYAQYTVPTTPSPAGTAFVKFEISLDNGVGTVYVDDASLTAPAVPEPASLGLLASGAIAMLVRRRR